MIVIPPVTITPARLISSSVAEPSAGEAVWNPATSYAIGTEVIRLENHRKYRNAIAGVHAGAPELNPDRWQDIGATNRYSMFDIDRNTQTDAPGPLTFVVAPGSRVDAVGIDGVEADSILLEIRIGGTLVHTAAANMRSRVTTSWGDYFFGTFGFKDKFARFRLPQFTGATYTITLARATGNVRCGAFVLGKSVDLGRALHGAETDSLGFSVINRKPAGELDLRRGKNVPKGSFTLHIPAAQVYSVIKFRQAFEGRTAMYFAIKNEAHPYFEAGIVLGIFRRFPVQLSNPQFSIGSIELEGY